MVTFERTDSSPLSAIIARTSSLHTTERPIIFLHGIFDSATCWFPVLEVLAKTGRHTIAIDQLGHGLSPRVNGDFRLPHLADLVYETLSSLGIDRTDVVGHSLGGLVAQQLAQKHPNLVASLTLEDPAWEFDPYTDRFPAGQLERVNQLSTWTPQHILAQGRLDHPLWDERDIAGWFEAKIDVDLSLSTATQDWQGLTGPEAWERYAGPVLLLTGDNTRGAIVTHEQVARAQAALGSRLTHVSIPDVGHDIRKDAPSQYLATLVSFLAANGSGDDVGEISQAI